MDAVVKRVFSIFSPTQVQVWVQALLESLEGRLWLQRVRLISPHLISAHPLLNRCCHTFSAHSSANSDQCSHHALCTGMRRTCSPTTTNLTSSLRAMSGWILSSCLKRFLYVGKGVDRKNCQNIWSLTKPKMPQKNGLFGKLVFQQWNLDAYRSNQGAKSEG